MHPDDLPPPVLIAQLAGAPVWGLRDYDRVARQLLRVAVRLEVDGLRVESDGETVTIKAGGGFRQELTIEEWAVLKALAADGSVDRLFALGATWLDGESGAS
jgi:hypothetical protein